MDNAIMDGSVFRGTGRALSGSSMLPWAFLARGLRGRLLDMGLPVDAIDEQIERLRLFDYSAQVPAGFPDFNSFLTGATGQLELGDADPNLPEGGSWVVTPGEGELDPLVEAAQEAEDAEPTVKRARRRAATVKSWEFKRLAARRRRAATAKSWEFRPLAARRRRLATAKSSELRPLAAKRRWAATGLFFCKILGNSNQFYRRQVRTPQAQALFEE